jgi:hypothetical protein
MFCRYLEGKHERVISNCVLWKYIFNMNFDSSGWLMNGSSGGLFAVIRLCY